MIVIYNRTRGGSSGWVSLTLTYASLGLWALFQLIFLVVFPSYTVRVLTGTVLFFVIGISNPLATVLLSRDMKLKVPGWFSKRNLFIAVALFYLAAGAYNLLLTPFTELLAEMLSIALLSVGVLLLIGAFGFFLIFRATGVRFWMLIGAASLLAALGVGMVTAFTDCCGLQGTLQGTGVCQGWMYDYADTLPVPCMEGLLPLSSNGVIFILIGEILALYALFRMMRVMR